MNKQLIKKIAGTVVFTFVMAASVFAQGKGGYVNSAQVVNIMPDTQAVNTQIETYAESLLTPDIKAKSEQMEAKLKAYQAEETTMSDTRKEVAQQEINRLNAEIAQFAQANNLQQKIAVKQQELMNPVYEKANKAISEVAKANGFTVVIDSGVGSIIYADESANMLPLLKAKLGIKD